MELHRLPDDIDFPGVVLDDYRTSTWPIGVYPIHYLISHDGFIAMVKDGIHTLKLLYEQHQNEKLVAGSLRLYLQLAEHGRRVSNTLMYIYHTGKEDDGRTEGTGKDQGDLDYGGRESDSDD